MSDNGTLPRRASRSLTDIDAAWVLLAVIAVAVPTLVSGTQPPSATFLNQAAAVIGWGAWLISFRWAGAAVRPRDLAHIGSLAAALGILMAAAVVSMLRGLPPALALSSLGAMAAALLVATFGAALDERMAGRAFFALCLGLLLAGLCGALIGIVQIFWPDLSAGSWIASTAIQGRAVGNLRQPNHLSSLLLWSLVAALWLSEARALRRDLAIVAATLLLLGIVLSASRTGTVGVLMLAAWGAVDRTLSRTTRWTLLALPLAYWACWVGLSEWTQHHGGSYGGAGRLNADGDISSSRFAIWRDTLALIARHPLAGIGFGEFNFAWSLTPFPQRPVAFFDHAHNLPLQFIAELGVPVAAAILGGLGYALWRAFDVAHRATGPRAVLLRAAFMMLLLMVLHSQLEYPLWYAYFLLPTAFLFGLCLGAGSSRPRPAAAAGGQRAMQAAAAAMMVVGAAAVLDYARVSAIFESDEARPLAERIESGKRSWFFAHHAHYAAATIAEQPSTEMPSFAVATHYLLDTRLMIAWAKALNESGDVERARHLAQRLREFRNPDARPFFEPCDEAGGAGTPPPFQCTPPARAFDYRDFR